MQHHSGTGILNWKFLDTEPWIILSIRREASRLYRLCNDRYDSNAACIFLHRKYPISVLEKENGMLDSDNHCKINFYKETGCLNEKDNRNNKRISRNFEGGMIR